MGRFLIICLGGALGTGARYLVSTWVAEAYGPDFPRGTVRFLEQNAWGLGTLNLALTVVLCLAAGGLGLVAARGVVRLGSALAR